MRHVLTSAVILSASLMSAVHGETPSPSAVPGYTGEVVSCADYEKRFSIEELWFECHLSPPYSWLERQPIADIRIGPMDADGARAYNVWYASNGSPSILDLHIKASDVAHVSTYQANDDVLHFRFPNTKPRLKKEYNLLEFTALRHHASPLFVDGAFRNDEGTRIIAPRLLPFGIVKWGIRDKRIGITCGAMTPARMEDSASAHLDDSTCEASTISDKGKRDCMASYLWKSVRERQGLPTKAYPRIFFVQNPDLSTRCEIRL